MHKDRTRQSIHSFILTMSSYNDLPVFYSDDFFELRSMRNYFRPNNEEVVSCKFLFDVTFFAQYNQYAPSVNKAVAMMVERLQHFSIKDRKFHLRVEYDPDHEHDEPYWEFQEEPFFETELNYLSSDVGSQVYNFIRRMHQFASGFSLCDVMIFEMSTVPTIYMSNKSNV